MKRMKVTWEQILAGQTTAGPLAVLLARAVLTWRYMPRWAKIADLVIWTVILAVIVWMTL